MRSALEESAGSLARREENSMLIEWKDAYVTGIDEFDDHHRKLFEMLNKSYFMIVEESSEAELKELLAELLDYIKYHFDAEEADARQSLPQD